MRPKQCAEVLNKTRRGFTVKPQGSLGKEILNKDGASRSHAQ